MYRDEFDTRVRFLAQQLPTSAEAHTLVKEYIAEAIARLEDRLAEVESLAERNLELDMIAAGMEDTPEGARLAQQVQAGYRASDYALRRLDLLQHPRTRGARGGKGQAPPDPPPSGSGAAVATRAAAASAAPQRQATPASGTAAAALQGDSPIDDGQASHAVAAAESTTPRFREPPSDGGAVASPAPPEPPRRADPGSNGQEPGPASGEMLTSEAISGGSAPAEPKTLTTEANSGPAGCAAEGPSGAATPAGPEQAVEWPRNPLASLDSGTTPAGLLTSEAILAREAPQRAAAALAEASRPAKPAPGAQSSGLPTVCPQTGLADPSTVWRRDGPGNVEGSCTAGVGVGQDHDAGVVRSPPAVYGVTRKRPELFLVRGDPFSLFWVVTISGLAVPRAGVEAGGGVG
jgi:hypothetical protein